MERVFLLLFIGVISCQSLSFEDVSYNDSSAYKRELEESLQPYIKTFMDKYDNVGEKEAFIFFSDPHLLGDNSSFTSTEQKKFYTSFESMKVLYDRLPIEFCLCGGDWLNNRDTQNAAKEKLLYADSKMKEWFPSYYKMMGNHDTNYQGFVSNRDSSRGDLPYDFINNEYYKDIGCSYYSIKAKETLFIILDTGIDWETSMDVFRTQQIEWLSQLLCTNTCEHLVIGLHMFFNEPVENNHPLPMSKVLIDLCNAFNKRKSYDVNGETYDFAEAQGTIHFFICGHNHVDFVYYESVIPCVGITSFITEARPSYDLCLIDYDNGYLNMIRVGAGQDRHIPIAM